LDLEDDELSWLRWWTGSRFARECREGDVVIRIWRSHKAKRPSVVLKAASVLRKQRTQKKSTMFYLRNPTGRNVEILWGQFQRLLKKLDYPRIVRPGSVQVVASDMAEAIKNGWNSAANS
jgi:hypothetical protein